MANIRCKMCGGNLNVEEGQQTVECEYCGSLQTVPTQIDNEKILNLHNRANALRLKQDFEKAMLTYESIIAENPKDAEAHFGMLLCKYGVTYVDDYNGTKKPTINRMQLQSIFDDIDYKEAIEHSDVVTRRVYEEEANKIANIQKKALAISQKEEPYDIFICYKETDASSKRTVDSVIAQQIYDELTRKGYRVFFSRITLESKLGVEYEPYIFAALNSSKVMLVIGTKQEYFNAVWVKNEWSRFLYLMNQKPGTKYLFPCYRDMEVYDLPEEMLGLQAQDLNKIGFIQDLTRGIDKVFNKNERQEPKSPTRETKPTENNTNSYDGLLKRAIILLNMGDFSKADSLLEEVLNQNPEDGTANLYKILATEQLRTIDSLYTTPNIKLKNNQYYPLVLKYGSEEEKKIVKEAIGVFEGPAPLTEVAYRKALIDYKVCRTSDAILNIMKWFEQNLSYKDSKSYYEKSKVKYEKLKADEAEATLKNKYNEAMTFKKNHDYTKAIECLKKIIDYSDSKEQIEECKELIREDNYQQAIALGKQKKYQEAIALLSKDKGYKDSTELIKTFKEENNSDIYNEGIALINAGNLLVAIEKFQSIINYRDSKEQIEYCKETYLSSKYNYGKTLIAEHKYLAATKVLKECIDYKDSAKIINEISKLAEKEKKKVAKTEVMPTTRKVTRACTVLMIISLLLPALDAVFGFLSLFEVGIKTQLIISSLLEIVIFIFGIFSLVHIFVKCWTALKRFKYYTLYCIVMILLTAVVMGLSFSVLVDLNGVDQNNPYYELNSLVNTLYTVTGIYNLMLLGIFFIVNIIIKKKHIKK